VGDQLKESTKALMAYLAVCLFWGSTYLAIRIGVTDFPPFVFAGIRHMISGTIMLSAALYMKKSFPTEKKDLVLNVLVGLFMLLGANGLVVYAEQWVDSGVTSLLVSLVPVYIAIIELVVLRIVKISWMGFFGLVMGFAGVYLLVRPANGIQIVDGLGVFVLIVASMLWAIGSVISTKVKSKDAIIAIIGIQMISGGIGCFIVSLFTGGIYDFELNFRVWAALWYLIIFGSIIGFSSYIYVLQKWPATKASTYAYVNPVVAVLLGAIILGEPITLFMVMGMVVILSGVFMVQRSKIRIR
jgi:drug/metabolite transporter (DMT)-like permease